MVNRVHSGLLSVAALSCSCMIGGVAAAATCPAVGYDTTCGAIITITDSGSTISSTGQGPYDGDDDTLVGVVNNSSQPIYAMGLRSPSDIFGFDGDGISTYGVPGDPRDATGYGGPNAYFSGISADAGSGVVNFITPVAANGGTSFFSLEDDLTKTNAVQDIVNGSISVALGGRFDTTAFGLLNLFRPTNITGVFTPNGGLTLAQAAQQTGFVGFDFQQSITKWPSRDLFPAGSSTPITAPPTFLDPPPGGYDYCVSSRWVACQTSYPFYPTTRTANAVTLFDSPRDPNLPAGSEMAFTSELIGILPGFLQGTNCLKLATPTCVDLGVGFDWTSNYNGSYGGIAVSASNMPIDPNTADGLGGVTLTDVRETSDYSPFSIITVNGVPITAASAAPEPSTFLLMTLSVWLIGSGLRARSSKWRLGRQQEL